MIVRSFSESLLISLGLATQLELDIFLPCSPMILEELGKPHTEDWNPQDPQETVAEWAGRNLSPWVTVTGDHWALTKKGVQAAREALGCIGGGNLTAAFLNGRLVKTGGANGQFMRTMRSALSRKLPHSAKADLIDDHIHNCIVRLICRDALRKHILAGRHLYDSLLATYMVRSAYNDLRSMGRNPICRASFGVRTTRERKKNSSAAEMPVMPNQPCAVLDRLPSPTNEMQRVEDRQDLESLWAKVETAVVQRSPQRGRTYLSVMQQHAEGYTAGDLAKSMGMDRDQAASLYIMAQKRVRGVARELSASL